VEIHPGLAVDAGIRFVDTPDMLPWRWTTDGVYKTASWYRLMLHGSVRFSSWKLTWKSLAPPRVKFFLWLAYQDRCWTSDRLAHRGLQHPPRCVLCDHEMGTMEHILGGCPYSRITWHEVQLQIRSLTAILVDGVLFVDWWDTTIRASPNTARKGISVAIMLTSWWLWKRRSAIFFDDARPNLHGLVVTIKAKAKSWATAGASGLTALPTKV
jgi:hypothetical protein